MKEYGVKEQQNVTRIRLSMHSEAYLEHAQRLVERARVIVVRESVLLQEILTDQTRDLEHHLNFDKDTEGGEGDGQARTKPTGVKHEFRNWSTERQFFIENAYLTNCAL